MSSDVFVSYLHTTEEHKLLLKAMYCIS